MWAVKVASELTRSGAMTDAYLDDNIYKPGHFFHGLPSFRFEEFLDNSLEEIYRMPREKTRDLRRVIRKENSFEIFEALWNLDEAHQNLVPPHKLVPDYVETRKSVKQSLMYLRHGDLQRHTNKDLALLYYNRSIIFAPHPPIRIGDNTYSASPEDMNEEHGVCDSKGWGRYASIARGFRARADLLFEMHQYQACIKDIDIVLCLGCPAEVYAYLQNKKAHCYQKSKPETDGVETFASFSALKAEPPVLEDPNPHLPAASSAVSLVYDDKGLKRHLKTNRSVKQGNHVAGSNKSFVTWLRYMNKL